MRNNKNDQQMDERAEYYYKLYIKAGLSEEDARLFALIHEDGPMMGHFHEPNVIDKIGFVIKKILG